MADYAQRIHELTDVRRRALQECENQRRLIGERLVDLPASELPEAAAPLVQRYRGIADRVELASSAIERMIAIDDRQSEIRDRMKELQKERDQLHQGLDGVYEQVGAVAFRLFRQHPLIDATYSSVFAGLARYQDDIRDIEANLGRYSADPGAAKGSVFERLGARGRQALLRNRRAVRENQLPRLLQDAGRKLVETDFISQIDDEELNRVSQPVRDAADRRQELEEALQELRTESGRLVDEFNGLSAGKKLPRARKDRQGEIDAARGEMNQVLAELGRIAATDPPEAVEAEVSALKECERRTAHFDQLIRRLQAGQQAELVERDIESLDGEIRDTEQRLADLRERRAAREANHADLVGERGDESDLFDD